MQKGIVKGDGCLRFLAHPCYCVTKRRYSDRLVHILSLSLPYAGRIGVFDLNFFDEFEIDIWLGSWNHFPTSFQLCCCRQLTSSRSAIASASVVRDLFGRQCHF